MAEEIRKVVFEIQVRTEDGAVKIEGLTKGFVKSEAAFKKMQTTLAETNKALEGSAISTGLANTAILEFGRTMSDAPYGIQGVGNNISQLVSILGQMSQKAKEGGSVIGSLRQAFVGPLGIVVAVQIAIAAFEIFERNKRRSAKATESLTEAVAKSSVELKLAVDVLNSETASLEKKNKVLSQLNEKYPDLNLQHSRSGEISDENRDKINGEIKAVENLAKARALQSVLEKLYVERAMMLAERAPSEDDGGEGFFARASARFHKMIASTGFYGSEAEQAAFDSSLKDVNTKVKSIVDQFEEDPALLLALIGSGKDKKLKKQSKDKVKALAVEVLDTTFGELEDREKTTKDRLRRLGIDIPSMLTGGEEGIERVKKGLLDLADGLSKDNVFADRIREMMRKAIFPEDVAMFGAELLGTANDLLASEADRAIAIETNKTNALNDQLKERLANEQLSAQERDKINQQISRNESALVTRENEINKKRFEQQKTLNLALAVIDTYVAANMALGDRTIVSTFVRVAAMVSIISSGLANVAAISRQKFTSKALPTPNLVAQGGGPADSQGPAFNIVGASGQSQLAQAIAAQQRDPVRAYVVAGEVTTAQSLERNKIQEASI